MVRHVFLDQNQWIYLSKDYRGHPHRQEHNGIAQQFLKMVQSDRIRLPLNTIHFNETLLAEDAGSRQRLAEIFDIFSQGWYTASWSTILPIEIRRAIAKTFGHLQGPLPRVFGKGFLFGRSAPEQTLLRDNRSDEKLWLLEQISAQPGAIVDLVTFPNESGRKKQNQYIYESGETNALAAERLRQARRGCSVAMQRRAQYAGYTIHHQDILIRELATIGKTMTDLLALELDKMICFWNDVPSLYVDSELTMYRDRQWSRKIKENDVRDFGHMALALPYCDLVVTEKFLAHAAVATGIDKKFGTVVCSDLAEALESLN